MNKRLSRLTVGLGIYIVISAAFMQQVRDLLDNIFGKSNVLNFVRLSFAVIALLAIWQAFKIRLSRLRICAISCLSVLAYLFSMWQPYLSERVHVLTYGLLGFLAMKDLIPAKGKLWVKNLILALSFVALISAADEIFQAILPYRVGEIRDFITNIISGVLGMALLLTLKTEADPSNTISS